MSNIIGADGAARAAAAAGFSGASLITMVAVCGAESGYDADAIGDVALESALWGPSVGLAQIRSLNVQKGTGGARDELANTDPVHNLKAAWSISGGGVNFAPWTTYNNGAYRKYIGAAQTAADNLKTNPTGTTPDYGAADPINLPGEGIIAGAVGAVTSPLDAAKSALTLATRAGTWIADRHNWIRILEVNIGITGLIVGLIILERDNILPAISKGAEVAAIA